MNRQINKKLNKNKYKNERYGSTPEQEIRNNQLFMKILSNPTVVTIGRA